MAFSTVLLQYLYRIPILRYYTVVDGTRSLDSAVCLTPECVRASAAILESLDESVDPCEDFYGYVCNGWIEKHPIPKG